MCSRCRIFECQILLALLITCTAGAWAQNVDSTSLGFFDIAITKDEIYSYTNLTYQGDYTSFESPSGRIALGDTEAGVTAVIILGDGSVSINAPESGQEKYKTVFGIYPIKTAFKSIYMRLNPKEYDLVFGKLDLKKVSDEGAFTKAKAIFDDRFLGSFHAGSKAIIPQYKTRYMEFETPEFGAIMNEEGYWLKLRRMSPYGSIYPANFVNPKQR
jgi:hypothetical protein